MIRRLENGRNTSIDNKIERERKFEVEKEMEFVNIKRNLNKENSKIDIEKIRNRNWLEDWRMKRIESQNEKTITPEKKITKKLVKSNKKKIRGKL